jgi:hypothetical protein
MEASLPFPEILFVSHYDHSTAESPSFNAVMTEKEAISEEQPIDVAEYKLVRVRKLSLEVKDHGA